MSIFDQLKDNSEFQRGYRPEQAEAQPVTSHKTKLRVATQHGIEAQQLPIRPWSELPLIEMLPANYRDEAQRILDQDPNVIHILSLCNAGAIDCWEAMRRLGMGPHR